MGWTVLFGGLLPTLHLFAGHTTKAKGFMVCFLMPLYSPIFPFPNRLAPAVAILAGVKVHNFFMQVS
jgi:hypothetical protein